MMDEPQSLQEINDLFWEGITLYKEGKEAEIAPQIWKIMQRVCKAISEGQSRKKIQQACAETIGWFPSQQQIAALRAILNEKLNT